MTNDMDDGVAGSNPPKGVTPREIKKMNALREEAKRLEAEASEIEARAKSAARRDEIRDRVLLGVAALELAKVNRAYARDLADQAIKLPPRDVRHLERGEGSLLTALKKLINDPPSEAISGEAQASDVDVPETAWFESPIDRRPEMDAAGSHYDHGRQQRYAPNKTVVLAMRNLGIPEVKG